MGTNTDDVSLATAMMLGSRYYNAKKSESFDVSHRRYSMDMGRSFDCLPFSPGGASGKLQRGERGDTFLRSFDDLYATSSSGPSHPRYGEQHSRTAASFDSHRRTPRSQDSSPKFSYRPSTCQSSQKPSTYAKSMVDIMRLDNMQHDQMMALKKAAASSKMCTGSNSPMSIRRASLLGPGIGTTPQAGPSPVLKPNVGDRLVSSMPLSPMTGSPKAGPSHARYSPCSSPKQSPYGRMTSADKLIPALPGSSSPKVGARHPPAMMASPIRAPASPTKALSPLRGASVVAGSSSPKTAPSPILKSNVSDRLVPAIDKGGSTRTIELSSVKAVATDLRKSSADTLGWRQSILELGGGSPILGTSAQSKSMSLLRWGKAGAEEEVSAEAPAVLSWTVVDETDFVIKEALEGRNVIGEGSGGKVFQSFWKGQRVAIKTLKSLAEYEERGIPFSLAKENLKQEGETLSSLNHPNIIKVVGLLQSANFSSIYLVQERCSAKNLRSHYLGCIQDVESHYLMYGSGPKKWLPHPSLSLQLALGLVSAVDYLHHSVGSRSPIIHRDIRPENCLLDAGNRLKLADFGSSRQLLDEERVSGGQIWENEQLFFMTGGLNSAHFAAPETLLQSQGYCDDDNDLSPEVHYDRCVHYDEKADIHSVGMVLWYIATATLPLHEINSKDVAESIASGLRPDSRCDAVTRMDLVCACYSRMMAACWDALPSSRPTAEHLHRMLSQGVFSFVPSVA